LAEAGVASRRHCKDLVLAGKVRVNGQIATSPGAQMDSEKDVIEVDGRRVLLDVEKIYILLNKPAGYLSTTADLRGRKTIMDLLPSTGKRIYPVGRLDKDTEGLLLITNDGDLTYRLTHPKHHVDKVYLAWVTGEPTDESLDKLRRGIMLEDGMTAPAIVKRQSCGGRSQLDGESRKAGKPESEGARERGSEGARERGNEGARERGNEGARERGNEGARERGNEETRERGNEGARERESERARERGSEGARERGSEGARERRNEGARERGSEGQESSIQRPQHPAVVSE
jgi:hypothetical protein